MQSGGTSGWVEAGPLEIGSGGALVDRPVEQPRGPRRYQIRTSVLRARRLAAERDFGGIAAEICDISLHPAERGLLIQYAVVPGVSFLAQM